MIKILKNIKINFCDIYHQVFAKNLAKKIDLENLIKTLIKGQILEENRPLEENRKLEESLEKNAIKF